MARLTENQAISRAISEDIWKVHIRESELGWGSDTWYVFFDSYKEAHDYYMEVNKDNSDDHVPDYYISASTPEKVVLTIK
jgi:hypothetical protein